jgi:hypothetical protein
LRYTIVASFIIEGFIILLTGGIHPNLRKMIILCTQFLSASNSN